MALFNERDAKPVADPKAGEVMNYGFALRVSTISVVEGGMLIKGVALSSCPVAEAGAECEVFMTEKNFSQHLGHNMARSLRDALKRPPEWFAKTEVVFGRAYIKDDKLIATKGVVGDYLVMGNLDSTRRIVSDVVMGRPVVTLGDREERATFTVDAITKETESIQVRITRDGKTMPYMLPVSALVETLTSKIAEQEASNKRIQDGKGMEVPVLRVSVPAYSPDRQFKVEKAEDIQEYSGMLELEAPAGARFTFMPGQDAEARAAAVAAAMKFVADRGGVVQATPVQWVDFNRQRAVEVARGFAGYLEKAGQDLPYQERWKAYEKVTADFNGLKDNYTPAILVAVPFLDKKTKAERIALDRVVPASSVGMPALPSILASAGPEEVGPEEAIDAAGFVPDEVEAAMGEGPTPAPAPTRERAGLTL